MCEDDAIEYAKKLVESETEQLQAVTLAYDFDAYGSESEFWEVVKKDVWDAIDKNYKKGYATSVSEEPRVTVTVTVAVEDVESETARRKRISDVYKIVKADAAFSAALAGELKKHLSEKAK